MDKSLSTKTKKVPGEVFDIPSIGVGEMRTVGVWIIIMLAAEDERTRSQIILEVMEHLGISIDDLQAEANDKGCPHCGISLLSHKKNDGKCF